MGNSSSAVESVDDVLALKITDADAKVLARERMGELCAFYDRYDPSKKSAVPTLMRDYNFTDVVKSLGKKYQDYPAGWRQRSQLLGFFEKRVAPAPDLEHVQLLLKRVDEAQVTEALQQKYGALPKGWGTSSSAMAGVAPPAVPAPAGAPVGSLEARVEALTKFYEYVEPSMAHRAKLLLSEYRFSDIVISLQEKYGSVPAGWEVHLPGAAAAAGARPAPAGPGSESTFQRRARELRAFYSKHDASRADRVENILKGYRFEDIVKSLKSKYGDVPAGWEDEVDKRSSSDRHPTPVPHSEAQDAGLSESAAAQIEVHFEKAVAAFAAYDTTYVRSNENVFFTYALHQQATRGNCDEEQPSWFSASAEQESRWLAWKQLVGMSRYNAMAQYIDEMREQTQGGVEGMYKSLAKGGAGGAAAITASLPPEDAALFQAAVAAMKEYDDKYERTMDEQVKLNALFCQATVGDCNQDKPDYFNAESTAKWEAWRSLAGLPRQKAAIQYAAEAERQRLPMSQR
eukprot:g4404.t1